MNFIRNSKEGEAISYYENGKEREKGIFKHNRYEGKVNTYYENGDILIEQNFKNGKLDGDYKEFYKEITSFLKEVEDHKKDFKNLEEIKKIKENEGWELLLEFNQAHALSKQREKERETERTEKEKQEKIKIEEERLKRIEEEKIRKNIA